MAKSSAKRTEPQMAYRRTVETRVASPTVPGARENVHRVLTVIDAMHKRKQLEERLYHAALMLQTAYETVYGQAGGALDFSRARGSGTPGAPPLPPMIVAAERLNDAKIKLYPSDWRIVERVVIHDQTIEQVASVIAGRPATHAERKAVSYDLRRALQELADIWLPEGRGGDGRIRAHREPGARPTGTTGEVVERGRTAHATSHKVFRG